MTVSNHPANNFNPFYPKHNTATEKNIPEVTDIPESEQEQEKKQRKSINNGVSIESLERQLKDIESQKGAFDPLAQCMKIALRIIQGDIVPDKDDKFLLEHYPEMHMKAWMLRRSKENPEKHDSVIGEDKRDNQTYYSNTNDPSADIPAITEAAAPEISVETVDVSC